MIDASEPSRSLVRPIHSALDRYPPALARLLEHQDARVERGQPGLDLGDLSRGYVDSDEDRGAGALPGALDRARVAQPPVGYDLHVPRPLLEPVLGQLLGRDLGIAHVQEAHAGELDAMAEVLHARVALAAGVRQAQELDADPPLDLFQGLPPLG